MPRSPGRRLRLFTMVELLLVLAMVGFLALAAVPRLGEARRESLRSSLARGLHDLASRQEEVFAGRGRYAADLGTLALKAPDGVRLTIRSADTLGWSASAEPEGLPGEACVIYRGPEHASEVPPADLEGVVACTF